MSDTNRWEAIDLSNNVGAVCENCLCICLRHLLLLLLLMLLMLLLLMSFRSFCGDRALLSQMRLVVFGQMSFLAETFTAERATERFLTLNWNEIK